MSRVRLTNPTMKTFSSHMGTTLFKDGESVDDVSPREIAILGSITGIEVFETDGSARAGGPSNDMIAQRSMEAPVEVKLVPEGARLEPEEITPVPVIVGPEKTVEQTDAEKVQAALDAEIKAMEEKAAAEQSGTQVKTYTREELEAVADDKGISGLREIGDEIDAKSNSIEGLIEKILSMQPAAKTEES